MNHFPTSLYIHIPFCRQICSYCDFCKYYNYPIFVNSYYQSLLEELNQIPIHPMHTIYIGGGTPSCLPLDILEDLLSHLKPYFSENMEFTIECNVEDVNDDLLMLFKRYSVNRLSIGVQTFQERLLHILDRSVISVKDKILLAKKYFNNINIDLMYALPTESLQDLESDLRQIIQLDVSHISCYSLILEPNTKLFNHHVQVANEDLDYAMYQLISDTLKRAGYVHYEISNYAKPGKESKHNLVYWHNERYYGIGLGASSYIENYRITNTRSINHYQTGKRIIEKEFVPIDNQMDYEMILGLRTLQGVSISHFFQKYHCNPFDVYDISKLLQEHLLKQEGDFIFIPEDKIYISNSILVNFLRSDSHG